MSIAEALLQAAIDEFKATAVENGRYVALAHFGDGDRWTAFSLEFGDGRYCRSNVVELPAWWTLERQIAFYHEGGDGTRYFSFIDAQSADVNFPLTTIRCVTADLATGQEVPFDAPLLGSSEVTLYGINATADIGRSFRLTLPYFRIGAFLKRLAGNKIGHYNDAMAAYLAQTLRRNLNGLAMRLSDEADDFAEQLATFCEFVAHSGGMRAYCTLCLQDGKKVDASTFEIGPHFVAALCSTCDALDGENGVATMPNELSYSK